MKNLLYLAVFVSAFAARAEEVPYIHMKVCDAKPYDGPRSYWDQTKIFCFEKDGQTIKYNMTDMGEIKLRDDNAWVNSEYVNALSARNYQAVGTYRTYSVRYLSTTDGAGGVTPFIAHVHFNWGPGTQTIYVFGEITADKVRLTGYSNGDSKEGDLRAAVNTVTNLLSAFNGHNPNREAVNQTKSEDRRRAEPVVDVVGAYRRTKIKDTSIENPKP